MLVQGVGFEPPTRWRHRQLFILRIFPIFFKLTLSLSEVIFYGFYNTEVAKSPVILFFYPSR
jgi:hypothetical protein